MKPQFTVIIPTRERPVFLRRAISSVLAQTYTGWELIVVEDDEAAPSRDAVEAMGQEESRIRYIAQPQSGPGAARKRGMEMGKGSYFCFLDDDDYYLPHHLKTLAEKLSISNSTDVLLQTESIAEWPDGRKTYPEWYQDSIHPIVEYWNRPENTLSYAIPRAALHRCPIDPGVKAIEDFHWICRLLVSFPLLRVNERTTVVTHHNSNRTKREVAVSDLNDRLRVIRELYELPKINERISLAAFRRLCAHQAYHFARAQFRAKQYTRAWRFWWKGWELGGWTNWREALYTVAVAGRALVFGSRSDGN